MKNFPFHFILRRYLRVNVMILALLVVTSDLHANNIQVSNVSLESQDTTNNTWQIQFDINWENSWRVDSAASGPRNWDAAWIFIKWRRLGAANPWMHATLSDGAGHVAPSGGAIDAGNDGPHGVMLHAAANVNQGPANYTSAQLQWQYGMDGLGDDERVEICVLAIEMVYVPQGAYELGDGSGGTTVGHFYNGDDNTVPYTVSGEGEITVGTTAGNLYYDSGGNQGGPIPPEFPKGYDAFYMMKYEISQGQYVEFLNKLTMPQAGNRFDAGNTGNRYEITGSWPNLSSTNEYVACNYLSWGDLTAYLDWAALSPMTELEYEKAGRGTLSAVAGEYAWGTAGITDSTYTLSNAGMANEGIQSGYDPSGLSGNASYVTTDGSIDGPLRIGIFAAHIDNMDRVTAGAGYYGIMELSGNVWERAVTVGNSTGRLFTGTHGDGTLAGTGEHDTAAWPVGASAVGSGFRGGSWTNTAANLRLSVRNVAAHTFTSRSNSDGGRGVRR